VKRVVVVFVQPYPCSGKQAAPLPGGSTCLARRVGMARCAVPARVVAGGTSIRATLTFEGVAPLHAARTSQRDVQRDVPTRLNTYHGNSTLPCARGGRRALLGQPVHGPFCASKVEVKAVHEFATKPFVIRRLVLDGKCYPDQGSELLPPARTIPARRRSDNTRQGIANTRGRCSRAP